MTYISQHIMSFVWAVVWFVALTQIPSFIFAVRFEKQPFDVVRAALLGASWAIIIVFWFN